MGETYFLLRTPFMSHRTYWFLSHFLTTCVRFLVWPAVLGYLHARLWWFLFCIKVNSASVLFPFDYL